MAKAGYGYEEAMQLPTWLFWTYCEGFERERMRDRLDNYSSSVAADSNIQGRTRAAMVEEWQALISAPLGNEKQAEEVVNWKDMSFEEKARRWSM